MCGIAGIIRFDDQPIARRRLESMLNHVQHRGPDGSGITEFPHCSFAHARLSVIDPPGGHQPMLAAAIGKWTGLTVIFNGEIYNHRQLRRLLEKLGHHFVSDHSDTEVLLHGYREWGHDLPRRIEGMFAFALWDAQERRLFLCRDRAGKKPLYFRRGDQELVFASLVGTFMFADPGAAQPRVNPDALRHYLRFGYTAQASLLDGVEELPAGSWLTLDADKGPGSERIERYWQLPRVSMSLTSQGLTRAIGELVESAVEKRLEADVPLGCFLSGGIDSSLIAAVAQKLLKARGEEPLRTFTVGMRAAQYDESSYARQVADHIGSRHTELTCMPDDVLSDLKRLTAVAGEPIADSSILPTFLLCRETRRHVKVALTGEGGDELFGGYDRYRAMRLIARYGKLLRRLPRGLGSSTNPKSIRMRLGRLLEAARRSNPAASYAAIVELFDARQLQALGLSGGDVASAGEALEALPEWPEDLDGLKAAMHWDMRWYLPFDLLRKMDRASMAVALEVRCPLLDPPIYELAAHLPTDVLMPSGRPKSLLRRVAAPLIPRQILRRPKQGFAVPIGAWFAGPLRQSLSGHLLEGRLSTLGIERSPIETWIREHNEHRIDHTHRLYSLLSLSLWLDWLAQPVAPVVGLDVE
ncbi:MAG: asparagine synthase (glutamine-hydrolyzing) [Phycisphaeraceae bacterium]|nr:asparagine synthase (glutamine-hydrolyzing) [Phycisphaeraceae bacterium]